MLLWVVHAQVTGSCCTHRVCELDDAALRVHSLIVQALRSRRLQNLQTT